MNKLGLPEDRRFRRLVRNMRRAGDISGRMIGCDVVRRRGHVYRLVPAKVFDDALEMLLRIGNVKDGE